MKEYSTAISIIEAWYQDHIRYRAIRKMDVDLFALIKKEAFLPDGCYNDIFDRSVDLHLDYDESGE